MSIIFSILRKSHSLALCLLLLSISGLQAQSFTETNHAYWYDPATEVRGDLLLEQRQPDSLQVYALLQLPENRAPEDFQLRLHLRNTLDSLSGELAGPFLLEDPGQQQAGHYLYQLSIPKHDSLAFLLLEIRDSLPEGPTYWAMAPVGATYSYPPPPFHLQQANGFPLFKHYRRQNQPLRILGQDSTYTLFFYKAAFDAASPPLAASPPASSSLQVSETRQLEADSVFSFAEEGLYFIQHDTSRLSGRSFRITSSFFPEVATVEDLSGPIRYISTQDEWARLEENDFSKSVVDRFWLKVARNEEQARRIIKNYYHRVALANRFFTNYKEGWKTDQGMIYILYGEPDVVRALPEKEEWIYRRKADIPEIKFTFVRVKNPFTDRHFVLLRDQNYKKTHYQIVSQWRKGRRTM